MTKSFRVALISPHSHISAIGLRQISACLKAAGCDCRLIFLPTAEELLNLPQPHSYDYPSTVLNQVCRLCADVDLVGISVMSNSVERARTLTAAIHERLSLPVIWGGIHPTVKPEECLSWADFVCVGEGEEAVLELVARLATGQDHTDIANIWSRDNVGHIVANPVRPLDHSLDDLPLPDYDLSQQYILHQGEMVLLTPKLLAHYMLNYFANDVRIAYMVCMTRGCPYNCTYCCANAFARIYPDWSQLRRRSFGHVVAEINAARQLIHDLEVIMFLDDSFLATGVEEIRAFSVAYRGQVGLPFFILASPTSVTREKLQCLVEAGLQDVEMGIQSGGMQALKAFRRTENNGQVLAAAQCLHSFQRWIPYPRYDIISDNPYETHADQQETLRLLYQLPRPFRLYMFSLTFYPGTELYWRAKADGLIQDDERDVYRKNFNQLEPTYCNIVLWCIHRNLPRWFLWLLIQPVALQVFDSTQTRWLSIVFWKTLTAFRIWQVRRKAFQETSHLVTNEQ